MAILVLLMAMIPVGLGVQVAQAVSPDVVISQVFGAGGSSGAPYTNDFVELFNRGTATVSLTGWSVQYASATGTGNFGGNPITALSGSLASGQYYLVQLAGGANGAALPTPDATGTVNMSGTAGKVALINTTAGLACNGGSTPCSPAQLAQIIDLVGWGTANFFEGAAAPATSTTTAIFRANGGCTDTDNNATDFAASAPTPRNTASSLHSCTATTNPSGVGTATPNAVFAGDSTLLTVAVTPGNFPPSTGLTVTADLTLIGGAAAQPLFDNGTNGDVTIGDNTFSFLAVVSPASLPGILTLNATILDAQGRSGTAAISLIVRPPAIPIHDIQGASHISPMNSDFVTTSGIVTAKRTNGFYVEDPKPDANDATSEGIFIFTSSAPAVTTGDSILVTGTVKEFRSGGASSTNLTTTELDNPGRVVTISSSGNPLPAPIVLGNGGRIPPGTVIENDTTSDVEVNDTLFDPAEDGIDFYESLEGMLVQVNDAVAVGPWRNFGSNREIPIVGDGGANAQVRTNRGGLVLRANDFNPERIVLNDLIAGGPILPSVNVNDSFPGSTAGVMDYSFGNFKLEVTSLPPVTSSGLTQETAIPGPSYQLAVATFNVENLSPKDPQTKFDQLAGLIVNNLKAPDIVAVEEIQDNNGTTDNGVVDANQTYAMLISAIQAAGGPAYDYRQINPVNDTDGGATGGNIRQGFLFRSDRGLSFVDKPGAGSLTADSIVAGPGGPELLYSPGRIDPTNAAFTDSRKPLAGEFIFKGDKVFVIANHFNSKSGDYPLFGHFQPPVFSSEIQRVQQAQVVHDFAASILGLDPAANVIVLGDLNDFQFSNPLTVLMGSILNNLIDTLPVAEQYTYVFDGNSEVLDQTLIGNGTFKRPFVYDVVHVNSEFAVQASDHEPQVSNLCVDATPPLISGTLSPGVLWPPNHKYVQVTASVNISDNADPAPILELVSVTSNEPDNGLGDGDTENDIVVVDKFNFELRAERSGTGNGRIYTITYKVTDACGNSTLASGQVLVPHDFSGQPGGDSPITVISRTIGGVGTFAAYPFAQAGRTIFLPIMRR